MVIPCYRVRDQVLDVVKGALDQAERVYCVDDACPEDSGALVTEHFAGQAVEVIRNEQNLGVGGAVKAGYRKALDDGFDIIVKLDGDGQMDPAMIPVLVKPLRECRADYCKGNRFFELGFLKSMPWLRLLGNTVLSIFSKFSSGYWKILDPTNGFTAIHSAALATIPLGKVHDRYFFESDLLFRLNIARAVVVDVPMPAKYGSEQSSLRIHRILPSFLFGHLKNLLKRIFYNYFLRDFSIASLELISGIALLGFSMAFGGQAWLASIESGVPASAGTVMLAGLTFLIGFQLLLAFLNYDIQNAPNRPLCAFRPDQPAD